MNVRRILLSLVLMLYAPVAMAQGFAGLGTAAEGFAVPKPGTVFQFPADHGAHPDYRIEWWYLTANLTGSDGKPYGVQWTLFRSALKPGDTNPQIWMGHAALTAQDQHFVAERLARGGIGQAGVNTGVKTQPFSAWIDDWAMTSTVTENTADALSKLSLSASGKDFRYDLKLDSKGPIVLQGQGGYSVKSAAGQASNYYSQPFYTVEGTLTLPQGPVSVTGQAWLDREWSSQPLAENQTGWDWFSLHMDSGEKLMGFRLRDGGDGYTSATWIAADGTPTPLPPGALKVTPLNTAKVGERTIPVEWRVDVPSRGFSVTTKALNTQSWMATSFPYWEGPINFTGSHSGRGYLEMTGYR